MSTRERAKVMEEWLARRETDDLLRDVEHGTPEQQAKAAKRLTQLGYTKEMFGDGWRLQPLGL